MQNKDNKFEEQKNIYHILKKKLCHFIRELTRVKSPRNFELTENESQHSKH